MPDLDALFRRMHVRRTTRPDGATRDPILHLQGYGPTSEGREDRYIDPYFGREYALQTTTPGGPLEVITRTYQTIFRGFSAGGVKRGVGDLLNKDPELLDFALGALFRYEPP